MKTFSILLKRQQYIKVKVMADDMADAMSKAICDRDVTEKAFYPDYKWNFVSGVIDNKKQEGLK